LGHSQMLMTRRRKQTAKMRLATAAKQEKRLGKENVEATSPEALTKRKGSSDSLSARLVASIAQ